MGRDRPSWGSRIVGVVVVGYLLLLLHAWDAVRWAFPRARWVARIDQKWTDLWMR
jgi:hypothetical protein